jgi:hypothetical protein
LNPSGGKKFFLLSAHPDCPKGPPSLLGSEYLGSYAEVEWLGRGIDHRPPSGTGSE